MKLKGFQKEDFKKLFHVLEINYHYNHYYENKAWEKKAKNLNRVVYDKIVSLKRYIELDRRFSNLKIGVCTPKKMAGRGKGGEYRSNLWIWMVNKSKFEELKRKKVAEPKLNLAQLQIGINDNHFTTAEIWFAKKSIEERITFNKFLKKNIIEDRKLNLYIGKEFVKTSGFNEKGTQNYFSTFKSKMDDLYYNEASLNIAYKREFVNKSIKEFLDTIKNDLIYIITNYYEPAYGKILKTNTLQRNPNPLKRKEVELKAYDVTREYFEKNGYEVKNVSGDNVGWDFEAISDKKVLLIEVKGLSGTDIYIELTPNEFTKSKKKNYIISVVRDCLKEPKIHIFTKIFNKWQDQHGNKLLVEKRTGARMNIE
jgi:hypothetical protein